MRTHFASARKEAHMEYHRESKIGWQKHLDWLMSTVLVAFSSVMSD